MKNYINYNIDLSLVPLDIKKTFYIDDNLIKNNVLLKDNNEDLITITYYDNNIKIAPFWEDKEDLSNIDDLELKYLLKLEWDILNDYVKKHPDFWIKVRTGVYEKLIQVNEYFKNKWFEIIIKIWFRPIEVQKKLFEELHKYFLNKFKNLNKDEIYKIVCEYVSDSDNFTPPHSTWWAVDLVLVDKNMNLVDMWYPINFPWEESSITYLWISLKQKQNRFFLCDSMLKFWFTNLASEWWHFSYWDSYWAYFYWKKESMYKSVL